MGNSLDDSGHDLMIGNVPDQSRTFDGIIDELRVSNTILTAGWIKTEYNSQFSPSTFVSVGIPKTP